MSFILNLLGVQTENAVNGLISTIVNWDPKSATEAELRGLEAHLDALGIQVAVARQAFEKERKESDDISRLYTQRLAAAEQIQTQLNITTDYYRRTNLEQSLATLLGMLEEMASEVEREKQDVLDANEFLQMLQNTYNQAGAKLRGAKEALTKAHRDVGRSEQQRQVAEDRVEAARQAAGLTGATSGLTVALKAMQDAADRNIAIADAANQKAKLLSPGNPEDTDPNISIAMARVKSGILGVPLAQPNPELAIRLQNLKQRQISSS